MYVSKFHSSCATRIDPNFNRFKVPLRGNPPGPGEYTPRLDTTKEGQYYIQKFTSSGARSQYHAERDTLTHHRKSLVTPGPGSYRMPSDFGQYESKNKDRFSKTGSGFFRGSSRRGS